MRFHAMTCTYVLFILTIWAFVPPCSEAQSDDAQAYLARMARPWAEPMHRITRAEYEATLQFWAERYAGVLSVEQAGASVEGTPIFLIKITDSTVPDADKQICLVSSLHGGPERSGTTAALRFVEWLISDDVAAAETRRKQVILVIPIINPLAFFETDRFYNKNGIDPYTGGGIEKWDLATLTYRESEKCPELMAFLSVVDRYRPEIHADLHGVGLQEYPEDKLGDRLMRNGHTMFEVVGSAYSNYALRPWDWRVIEVLAQAAQETGAGTDRFEADAQRSFWGPGMEPIADRVWEGRPKFYSAQYAYAKYHTMPLTFEVGYEGPTVSRLKALLNIGNTPWVSENAAGYPVDRMTTFCGHYVTAYGQTAEARRASRAELWLKQGMFTQGILYPQFDGRDMYVCAVTPEARALLTKDPQAFLANCANVPNFNAAALRAFIEAGPEVMVYPDSPAPKDSVGPTPIVNGVGFRFRIPYRKPELIDLRLNGNLLAESATDGYQSWFADGFTQVQVNVPPDKASTTGLFVITCAYLPDEKREFGWMPPQEVLEKLKQAP